MPRLRLMAIAIAGAALAACASAPPLTDTRLCDQLSAWAITVQSGQSSTVRLIRGGAWMVDHYKQCESPDEDKAASAFCAWLMENTSTEFMEANISRTMSCLQDQRISGYLGNTGIESWSGKASFYSPHLAAEDVQVDIEYSLDNSVEVREDFLQITVRVR